MICSSSASTPTGSCSCIVSRRATGAIEALPAAPDTVESDDAVVVSLDGKRVYFFGRPLGDTAALTGFYQLDLESRRVDPLANVPLREPVSMAVNRANGDIYFGGRAGDAFQILRMSAGQERRPLRSRC